MTLAAKIVVGVVLLCAAGAVVFFGVVPGVVARRMNPVHEGPAQAVSAEAAALHRELHIVDLHADPLLWPRDLGQRGEYGHVDLPRLLEGNVALQVFGLVTRVPATLSIEQNPSDAFDLITPLAVAQRWPPRAWGSRLARALHQAQRLEAAAVESDGRLTMIASRQDLRRLLARRGRGEQVVGAMLGLEGGHALEGRLEHVEVLYEAGVRLFGLVHLFDNALGGSAHGVEKGGLTDFGRQVVARTQALGMVIDLAHASPALLEDVVQMTERPVVVSHTGVRGTCESPRNLTDRQLRLIAGTGGLIGIGYWETAVCGRTVAAVVRAIRHARDVVGAGHVALGSDFDGAVAQPFDASEIDRVTQGLLEAGFPVSEIRQIMGENALRLLESELAGE